MMMASLFNSADLPKSQVANQTAVAEYIKFAAEKKLCKHRVLVHGRKILVAIELNERRVTMCKVRLNEVKGEKKVRMIYDTTIKLFV